MDRRIDPTEFADQLADYTPEVRDKAIEIANQLLVNHPDLSKRMAFDRALQQAEQWWIDRAG